MPALGRRSLNFLTTAGNHARRSSFPHRIAVEHYGFSLSIALSSAFYGDR